MIVKFVEASDGTAYGKFLVARLTPDELATPTALPGYTGRLLTLAGQRKFNESSTLVLDLQTGRGHVNPLDPFSAHKIDEGGKLWVCPLHRTFLGWLCQQGLDNGTGDITTLPAFVDLS